MRKIVVVVFCLLVFGSLAVLLVNNEYEQKDIVVTVRQKWIEDGRFYFNDIAGRRYELANSYRPPLADSRYRFNDIVDGKNYVIDTMGGRLNISIFPPNAYNFREVIGLDSSKPLFLFES